MKTEEKYINELNECIKEFNINSRTSFIMFMATCAAESGYGKDTIEQGDDKYFKEKEYDKNERGVGYIQLTHKYNHKEFLKFIKDTKVEEILDTASYINNLDIPWKVSAYTWCKRKFGGGVVMNEYAQKRGLSINTFLSIQYFINGYPNIEGFGNDISKIFNQKDNSYIDNDNNVLLVNGNRYPLPNGWEKRKEAYNNAVKVFEDIKIFSDN